MASDDTTMLLEEAYVAALRLVVRQVADHDVVEVYRVARVKGPVAELVGLPMRSRGLDV